MCVDAGGCRRTVTQILLDQSQVHSRFKQKLRLGAEQGAIDRIIVGERRNHGRNDVAELPDFVRVGMVHRERPGPQRFPPYHRGHWLSRSSECIPKRNRALRVAGPVGVTASHQELLEISQHTALRSLVLLPDTGAQQTDTVNRMEGRIVIALGDQPWLLLAFSAYRFLPP